jgi:hypothetical protein
MTVIKKLIEFKVSEPTDLREMTIQYYRKSGFKQKDSSPNEREIKFGRGSIASNMWTFNPLNWKSEIDIEFNGQEVKAQFNINAAGTIPTNKDEILWQTFIDNYQKYLCDSNFDFLTENSKTLRTTQRKNLKYLGWALLGGIIGGIPAGLIAYWTGINTIVSIGAGAGTIALLTMKINDDKKKNAL